MSEPLVVDLFVEDRAHEVFVGALASRITREEQLALILQARSARGGHPRALGEFGAYQALVADSVVLARPNNAGKSTLLQAIATWKLGLDRWVPVMPAAFDVSATRCAISPGCGPDPAAAVCEDPISQGAPRRLGRWPPVSAEARAPCGRRETMAGSGPRRRTTA